MVYEIVLTQDVITILVLVILVVCRTVFAIALHEYGHAIKNACPNSVVTNVDAPKLFEYNLIDYDSYGSVLIFTKSRFVVGHNIVLLV